MTSSDTSFMLQPHLKKVRDKLYAHRDLYCKDSEHGVRLDIPSAKRGLAVLAIHERPAGGKVLGYDRAVLVLDARFLVQPAGMRNVGLGAAKYPMAYVAGRLRFGDETVLMDELRLSEEPRPEEDWRLLYYNPRHSHLFVEAFSRRPVEAAERVHLVRQMMFAKGLRYYSASNVPAVPAGMKSLVEMPIGGQKK